MNRLWVRLSLIFTAVLLTTLLTIGIAIRLTNALTFPLNTPPPPEVQAYFDQLRQAGPPLDIATIVLVTTGMMAIMAGIWMSHSLIAPLSELEQAAQAIGRRELSYRLPASLVAASRGSQELVSVAAAFNDMAAQLEQAENLRRNLLADVSHELRHPLHILQGNLQAMLDDVYPLNKEEIARLADQTRHLTTLVNDLHELALAEAHQLPLHLVMLDVAALVKETAVPFKPLAADKNITLRIELLGVPPQRQVDPNRLRQAIQNLLNNALRHTPEGGTITIRVGEDHPAAPLSLFIQVADTGSGIAPEHLPHLFDRFYRTESGRRRPDLAETAGTGLGLAIVKAIVEAHGGHVSVESPGLTQGSRFTLHLP